MSHRTLSSLVLIALVALCSITVVSAQDVARITFWSNEFQPVRVERQQEIINAFQEQHPDIEIELVVMDENLMDELMTLNTEVGAIPDVVLHPLHLTAKWYDAGILDATAATEIINGLGEETFNVGALELYESSDADGWMAVPSDGWGQMIYYRADLFEEAGLEPPDSYENILAAAEVLDDPDNDFVGFLGASSETDIFTWQVFEHIALANGATLTDDKGDVSFDSLQMIEALEFYVELMTEYGPLEDDYDAYLAREDYLAGRGAMLIWSPFLLDELAGLQDDLLPTCPECEDDIAYLAHNTGVISAIEGPQGDHPVAWGSINALGISYDADPAASIFIDYWMSDAYLDVLSIAPEGKFPMRIGTQDQESEFVDGWRELPVGVDRRAPLSDFYGEDILETIVADANEYTRMGFGQGEDLLASAVGAKFFIQENIVLALYGELTIEEAIEEIQIEIEDLQFELEEDATDG